MFRALRFILLALCCCMGLLPALAACNSSAAMGVPTVPPTQSATRPAVAVTATAAPDEAFTLELGALTTLRGRFTCSFSTGSDPTEWLPAWTGTPRA
jgi:hypothetical protein